MAFFKESILIRSWLQFQRTQSFMRVAFSQCLPHAGSKFHIHNDLLDNLLSPLGCIATLAPAIFVVGRKSLTKPVVSCWKFLVTIHNNPIHQKFPRSYGWHSTHNDSNQQLQSKLHSCSICRVRKSRVIIEWVAISVDRIPESSEISPGRKISQFFSNETSWRQNSYAEHFFPENVQSVISSSNVYIAGFKTASLNCAASSARASRARWSRS